MTIIPRFKASRTLVLYSTINAEWLTSAAMWILAVIQRVDAVAEILNNY